MPAPDQWDTGYRSSDWNERADWTRPLDYHDVTVDLVATQLCDDIWKMSAEPWMNRTTISITSVTFSPS